MVTGEGTANDIDNDIEEKEDAGGDEKEDFWREGDRQSVAKWEARRKQKLKRQRTRKLSMGSWQRI